MIRTPELTAGITTTDVLALPKSATELNWYFLKVPFARLGNILLLDLVLLDQAHSVEESDECHPSDDECNAQEANAADEITSGQRFFRMLAGRFEFLACFS